MTTIQIRDVPVETSRALKARAAREGRSLSDYLLREIEAIVARPSRSDLLDRLAQRPVRELPAAADVLRDQRPR